MIIKFSVRLVDDSGKFRVPTVFVTNAGNTLRKKKADQLSTWLGVEIEEDQVIMLTLFFIWKWFYIWNNNFGWAELF